VEGTKVEHNFKTFTMKAITFFLIIFIMASNNITAQDTIHAVSAKSYIGKKVVVCDRVNYGRLLYINKKAPTILFVGPDHPNHYLTLYFPYNHLRRFSFDPEKKMINKRFCATGTVKSFEGKPALYIKNEANLNVEEVNSFIFDFDEKIKNE